MAASVGIASIGARAFDVRKRARTPTSILTLETPVEVPVGKKKSKTEVPTPEWLTGLDSITLEERLWFRNWTRWGGWFGLDDEHKEIIKRGWLPVIRGEHKKYH